MSTLLQTVLAQAKRLIKGSLDNPPCLQKNAIMLAWLVFW